MNIQILLKTLKSLSSVELDHFLVRRDSPSFDIAWTESCDLFDEYESFPDEEDIFIKLSEVTNQHEICSYISDDFELLYEAERKSIENPFLSYLKETYKQGKIPYNWKG